MNRIEFKQYSYRFPTQEEFQLKNFSFFVEGQKWINLSGRSGSGKSTFFRILNGLIPYFYGGVVEGEVWVNDRNPVQERPSGMSDKIQLVFQNPLHQMLFSTVEEELSFSLESKKKSSSQVQEKISKVLEAFELADFQKREIESLSAGEKQMVALASVFLLNPSILLLDEPLSQLDVYHQQLVHWIIRNNFKEREMLVFWSDHRKSFFQKEDLYLTFPGEKKNPYWEIHPKKKSQDSLSSFSPKPFFGPPILSFFEVDFSLGPKTLFKNFSFEISKGQTLLVTGENGSGKTTLLRLLQGSLKPFKGKIIHPPLEMGYIPQDLESLFFHETLWEELCYGCKLKKIPLSKIEEVSENLSLRSLWSRNPRDLSLGEQQRAALGVVLVFEPELILLDEPSRGLDEEEIQMIVFCLQKEKEKGRTLVIGTHQPESFLSITDQILPLPKG